MWNQNPSDMVKYYCNTLTRMDSLLMGCLLAVWLKEGKTISNKVINRTLFFCASFFTIGVILGENFKQTNPYFSTIGYTIVSIFFAALLYQFIKGEIKPLIWLKNSPVLNFIGKISFGIYVFHIPIYLVLSSMLLTLLQQQFGMNNWTALFSIASISLVLTLVASILSFYLLEKPILNLKRHFQ